MMLKESYFLYTPDQKKEYGEKQEDKARASKKTIIIIITLVIVIIISECLFSFTE